MGRYRLYHALLAASSEGVFRCRTCHKYSHVVIVQQPDGTWKVHRWTKQPDTARAHAGRSFPSHRIRVLSVTSTRNLRGPRIKRPI